MYIDFQQLWDVCFDQEVVDFVCNVNDFVVVFRQFVNVVLDCFSMDNLLCMVVCFDKVVLMEYQINKDIGVEIEVFLSKKISEVDKIVVEMW